MIGNRRLWFFLGSFTAMVITIALGFMTTRAGAQKAPANTNRGVIQQPLYSDYKGVRIGMLAEEVRAKLGKPTMGDEEQDYYIVSQTETVQIAYDAAHKAKAISVDFIEGIGAPDYKAVVGPDVQVNPDGSMYKLVPYDRLGFWVSYNRSAGSVIKVSITIQKFSQ